MEDQLFRCRHCKRVRRKRTDNQRYCGRDECQRARKNLWRREKYATDPDYRVNQKASTNAWLESQGGGAEYHRGYRKRRNNEKPQAPSGTQEPPPPEQQENANSDAKSGQ